jgi:hypothetical protein
MATTNIWKKFTTLLPKQSRTIATIISNNGNGTSTAQLRDGSVIIVIGENVSAGNKAMIDNHAISHHVPDLPTLQRTV